MDSIGSIIPKTIKKAGIEKQINSIQILDLFEKHKDIFLHPNLMIKVKAVYFKNDILNIASLSTEASQELASREFDIIQFLNKKLGCRVVEKIAIIV